MLDVVDSHGRASKSKIQVLKGRLYAKTRSTTRRRKQHLYVRIDDATHHTGREHTSRDKRNPEISVTDGPGGTRFSPATEGTTGGSEGDGGGSGGGVDVVVVTAGL